MGGRRGGGHEGPVTAGPRLDRSKGIGSYRGVVAPKQFPSSELFSELHAHHMQRARGREREREEGEAERRGGGHREREREREREGATARNRAPRRYAEEQGSVRAQKEGGCKVCVCLCVRACVRVECACVVQQGRPSCSTQDR
jgi:hypothetical protein